MGSTGAVRVVFVEQPGSLPAPPEGRVAVLDGLLSAVKFLRKGEPPWPEADEDARAADSPGRGHALSSFGQLLVEALDEAGSTLRSKGRESLRQELVEGLVRAPEPLPA